jgi:ABC-type taurine transport system ATPase subunit
MTVAGNVAFPLKMAGKPNDETATKVKAALAPVHVEEKAASFEHEPAGGQKQRVAMPYVRPELAANPAIFPSAERFRKLQSGPRPQDAPPAEPAVGRGQAAIAPRHVRLARLARIDAAVLPG